MKFFDWMKRRRHNPLDDLYHSQFQKIFLASKVNGGVYVEPPSRHWSFPKNTWFQRKLEERNGS